MRTRGEKSELVNNGDSGRCCWFSGLRQCQMLGTISQTIGKTEHERFYCLWHYKALDTPEFANDFQAFLELRNEILKNYKQSQFHADLDLIWNRILGQADAL